MSDLHIGPDEPTQLERAAVDSVVGPDRAATIYEDERVVRGGARRRNDLRTDLLPVLHELQRGVGYISAGALNLVAERLGVAPAESYGVATFYSLLSTEDPGHRDDVTHVCVDSPCRAGADALIERLEADGERVARSACLGQCERAPAQFRQCIAKPDSVDADERESSPPIFGDADSRRLTRRIGVVDPSSLQSYRDNGGYRALSIAISMGAEAVIDVVEASGLTGRGGAAFPTSTKWRAVREATNGRAHVIANLDESEPGTFKDRVLAEHDPFAIVESLCVAAYAAGASNGWIYVRGEYPRVTQRVTEAVEMAREAGLLGSDILGSGFDFDIEIRSGAGAYVCGEETALLNSIEGRRGEPRQKPPFPSTNGLFGEPTAVNNPETLFNVLDVLVDGVEAYRSRGTQKSPGTKLFSISGAVDSPGVYEVPFGHSLAELLADAGACSGPRAVLLGGAAGRFVDPDQADLALSLEDAEAAGLTLGSGAVVVYGPDEDMSDVCVRLAEFFADESCGQCVPCRVGTVRQREILVQLGKGADPEPRLALIDDIADAMADSSICGLGHTAAGAVQSAIALGLIGRANER